MTITVSVAELQQHAWQGEHVSTSAFRVSVHELRQSLRGDLRNPQYIETVRGQGYRFCMPVTTSSGLLFPHAQTVIERADELSQLQSRLTLAQHGQRQLIFVSGEAGMGKTTLVNAFLTALADDPGPPIGQGYCIEHHGPAEAYLPVLQALGDLGQTPFRDALVRALQHAAPTWLRQLPRLLPESEHDPLNPDIPAATRVRMIRELVDALDILSADRLVVLVLEDLHWSDPSTIDLLDAVRRRVKPARLYMLCTYRPLEVQVHDHPLFGLLQEHQGHGRELDVRLTPWAADMISAFLGQHLAGAVDEELTTLLQARSDGNPLFLSRLVDYLRQQELLIDIDGTWHLRDADLADQALPDRVRQLLSKQLDQLPEMVQEVLQAASVAGMQFATAMVAAGAETQTAMIDEALSWAASRSYFLQAQGIEAWPDGTVSGTFRFSHALYRQVLYDRLSVERRVKLHRLMAERLERAYIDDLDSVSGQLAYHFVQGMEVPRALHYLHRASVRALRRFAANEAIDLLNTALELLPELPPEHDNVEAEYPLQATLGKAIIAAKGAWVPEASAIYQRAYRLGKTIRDINQFFPTLLGLESQAMANADYTQSQHLCGQLLNYAQITQDPLHLAYAYGTLVINQAMQGHYLAAHDYTRACQRLRLPLDGLRGHLSYTQDPVVMYQSWEAKILIDLGYPAQAIALSQACLARARDLGDPYNVIRGLQSVTQSSMYCDHPTVTYEAAQAMIAYAAQQGQPFWEQIGTIYLVWAMARLGYPTQELAQLEAALTVFRAIGLRNGYSLVLNLAADACYYAGHIEAGLTLLREAEAMIDKTGERISEPRLHELRGKLLHRQGHFSQAETCFVRALTLARQQHAKGIELRTATPLSRLWQAQGKPEQARDLLWPIYNGFTEGFDTAELQEAKALLT